MQENFYDPESGSSSGATHVFPSNFDYFWVPEPCRAAILDCRAIHKMVRVLQETFLNDHLFKKDYLLQSSTVPRIWHPPLRNWDLRWIVKPYWWNLFSVFSGRHMDNVPKETYVLSVMTDKFKDICTVVRDEKNDRLRGEKPSKTSGNRRELFRRKKSVIPCRHKNCFFKKHIM